MLKALRWMRAVATNCFAPGLHSSAGSSCGLRDTWSVIGFVMPFTVISPVISAVWVPVGLTAWLLNVISGWATALKKSLLFSTSSQID